MATGDFPNFVGVGHSHTNYNMGNMAVPTHTFAGNTVATGLSSMDSTAWSDASGQAALASSAMEKHHRAKEKIEAEYKALTVHKKSGEQEMAQAKKRIVRVYIADPNENVPVEASVLYTGSEKATDATDQELFYELDIKDILSKYNEKRVKFRNKAVKDREEFLESARIRDLSMLVVTLATF